MKIRSIGLNVDGRMVLRYEGGGREEFIKCPFFACKFFHAEGIEICDTTGKSIADEIRRQTENKKRELRAIQAKTEYRKCRKAFRYQWRGWLGIWGAIVIGALLVLMSDETTAETAIGISLLWAAVWIIWQSVINSRIEDKACEIRAEILKGGCLNSHTIASYLKKS